MRGLIALTQFTNEQGYKSIGAFNAKASNWGVGLPYIASEYDMRAIISYPANSLEHLGCPEYIRKLATLPNTEVHLTRPNMTPINAKQAENYILSKDAFFIPFGLSHPVVLDVLSAHFTRLPHCNTLILSSGSGTTLSGVLMSLMNTSRRINSIIAVSAGRTIKSIKRDVERMTNSALPETVCIIHEYDYWRDMREISKIISPWPTHSHYERKAYDWLTKHIHELAQPILFLNMGANI